MTTLGGVLPRSSDPLHLLLLHRMILIGQTHTMFNLHTDNVDSATWQTQIKGRKRWRVCPPTESPYLYENKEKRKTGSSDLVRFFPRLRLPSHCPTIRKVNRVPCGADAVCLHLCDDRTPSTSISRSFRSGSTRAATIMSLSPATPCTTRLTTGIRR